MKSKMQNDYENTNNNPLFFAEYEPGMIILYNDRNEHKNKLLLITDVKEYNNCEMGDITLITYPEIDPNGIHLWKRNIKAIVC